MSDRRDFIQMLITANIDYYELKDSDTVVVTGIGSQEVSFGFERGYLSYIDVDAAEPVSDKEV